MMVTSAIKMDMLKKFIAKKKEQLVIKHFCYELSFNVCLYHTNNILYRENITINFLKFLTLCQYPTIIFEHCITIPQSFYLYF